jgi:hypothetical protein
MRALDFCVIAQLLPSKGNRFRMNGSAGSGGFGLVSKILS